MADAPRRRGDDLRSAAVIAPQHRLGGTRVRAPEREQVVELGPAPAIQQLVVVAGDDERSARRAAARAGQAREQRKLGSVGVLELVDDDVTPQAPVPDANLRIVSQERDAVGDQVGEVERV